jgi:type I restriction-modification system DNA methylase subunit
MQDSVIKAIVLHMLNSSSNSRRDEQLCLPDFPAPLKTVGLPEAGSVLGVSSATVRNWVKHKYLKAIDTDAGLAFDALQLADLKNKLLTGHINRLTRRANKRESTLRFIPAEYAENPAVISAIQHILAIQTRQNLDANTVLLCVILNILQSRSLIQNADKRNPRLIATYTETLKDELEWWFSKAKGITSPACAELVNVQLPNLTDFLGLLYQSLAHEGHKATAGSYYTPRTICDEMAREHVTEKSLVLDPCCGTGQFLLSAAATITNPEGIWGFDIDPIAVRLARLNLLLQFQHLEFAPHIYCKNVLLDFALNTRIGRQEIPEFDLAVTNPPWGVHFSTVDLQQLQNLYPSVRSGEAFSFFLQRTIQFLRPGGELSFILPESVLNIRTHADIRQVILERTRIRRVVHLGRIFQNVFTPAVRLDLTKDKATHSNRFTAVRNHVGREVEQNRLLKNSDFIFDVFTSKEELSIFERIYESEHTTLERNADWALGIVTGDNAKYLSTRHDRDHEPILTGKELKRFRATAPKKFIHFSPANFQQVAPVHKYRTKEKLIYKFISKELVFAYDDKQTLSLNSANILIPALKDYPIKSVLGVLNSTVHQFLFQKKFGALKILRGDIEKLPFPIISQTLHQKIIDHVNVLLHEEATNGQKKESFEALNECVMDAFRLTDLERQCIRANVQTSANLLPFCEQ